MVGVIIAARGMGGMIGFLVAGYTSKFDPRISMTVGFGMLFVAGLWLMAVDLNVTVLSLFLNAFLQGMAIAQSGCRSASPRLQT